MSIALIQEAKDLGFTLANIGNLYVLEGVEMDVFDDSHVEIAAHILYWRLTYHAKTKSHLAYFITTAKAAFTDERSKS